MIFTVSISAKTIFLVVVVVSRHLVVSCNMLDMVGWKPFLVLVHARWRRCRFLTHCCEGSRLSRDTEVGSIGS